MTQKDTNFFNIDDMSQGIARTLTDGITTRIFPGKKAMISVVRIEPNAVGAIHSHPQEQWGLMLEGSAVRIQDGEEIEVKKGDFWVSPGGVEHGVIGGPDGAVILDVFSPPRYEYTRPVADLQRIRKMPVQVFKNEFDALPVATMAAWADILTIAGDCMNRQNVMAGRFTTCRHAFYRTKPHHCVGAEQCGDAHHYQYVAPR